MPRDGSGIYTKPFPDVIEGTTIESAVHNGTVADVETDLNAPRPIIAGGTGATSAAGARSNLGAERAMAQVTNYDSHVFENGSFWSAPGATGAPNGSNSFAGIAYIYGGDGTWMAIEARDLTDPAGIKYVRERDAGVWGAWRRDGLSTIAGAEGIASVTGDMWYGVRGTAPGSLFVINSKSDLTGVDLFNVEKGGAVTIQREVSASLTLRDTGAGGTPSVTGSADGNIKWSLSFGTTPARDFTLGRHNDAGAQIDQPIYVVRSTGDVKLLGNLTVGSGGSSGVAYLGNTGTHSVNYDGTQYNMPAANLSVGGAVITSAGGGILQFGGAATSGVFNDSADVAVRPVTVAGKVYFQQPGGAATYGSIGSTGLQVTSHVESTAGSLKGAGHTFGGTGYYIRAGISAPGFGANVFNINWTGSPQLWMDASNMGTFAFTSDYRVKKDVVDLPRAWDQVKALRPVKYTQAQYTPQIEVERRLQEAAGKPAEMTPMFAADDTERWGFIAHELQDTLIESAATGYKDAPDTVQSPNPWTLIAALTSALQEAMERIEVLENIAQPP